MSKTAMLSLLAQGNTGSEILSILNAIVSGYEYVESPVIEQVIGIPTLAEIAF
jgi:hypothetical protein